MPSRICTLDEAKALFAPLRGESIEVAAFAYLGADWQLLGLRHARSRCSDHIAIPMREVATDALAFGATAIIMAHNHPSGDPTPSAADLAATRRLAGVLEVLGVRLLDHLVMGGADWTSLRERGVV